MSAVEYGFEYQSPEKTSTIEDYISCKSDTAMTHRNSSFLEHIGDAEYCAYNVVSDYLDEIRDNYCIEVEMTSKDLEKYKYKPKLLCYDIYGSGELAFIVLLINDMSSAKQFVKGRLLLPTKENMNTLCNSILNSNRNILQRYNA